MKGELNIFEEAKMLKRRAEIAKFINQSYQESSLNNEIVLKGYQIEQRETGVNDRMAVVMGEQLT